jgi:hypothetical protein
MVVAASAGPPPPPPLISRKTWTWIAGGAGIAAVAGGVVAGSMAQQSYDKAKQAAADGNVTSFYEYKSQVRPRSNTADALYVAGAAGIGTAAYLYFTGRDASIAAAPTTGGLLAVLEGRF